MRGNTKKLREDGILEVWEKYERRAYEIAEVYNVSPGSVYAILKAYCIFNGLVYEEYLRFPHKPHKIHIFKVKREKTTRRLKKYRKRINPVRMPKIQYESSFEKEIDFLIELIDNSDSTDIDILVDVTTTMINLIQEVITKGDK